MSGQPNPAFRYIVYVSPTLYHETQEDPKTWHLDYTRSRLLAMLPPEEQTATLRFLRAPDKARALGSRLLKHLAIARTCNVAWHATAISMHPVNGKPFYQPPDPAAETLEFNVSHDDNVVILAGVRGTARQIGIDVMNVKRARDESAWREHGGWEGWINVFEAALHPNEMLAMRAFRPSGPEDDAARTQRLRLFYCYWVLKEAYIKMTGEAFLDPHIKQLEFRNARAPAPALGAPEPGTSGPWGEIVNDFQVWRHGRRLRNVYMELQALGTDYVVATAISTAEGEVEEAFAPVEVVDMQKLSVNTCG